jgi:hypothetical protein
MRSPSMVRSTLCAGNSALVNGLVIGLSEFVMTRLASRASTFGRGLLTFSSSPHPQPRLPSFAWRRSTRDNLDFKIEPMRVRMLRRNLGIRPWPLACPKSRTNGKFTAP